MTIAVVLGQLLYNDNCSILWASLCCIEWRHLGIALHCESRRSIYLKNILTIMELSGPTTLSLMGLFATFSITSLCIEFHHAECRVSFIVTLCHYAKCRGAV